MTLTSRSIGKYGYIPDLPDDRDYSLCETAPMLLRAVSPVSTQPINHIIKGFHKRFPIAYNQGNLGSCVANSCGLMFCYIRGVSTRSRLQIYYEGRRLINMTTVDSGCYIRDVMRVLAQLGAGRESWWPYVEDKFTVDPPLKVDRDALMRRIMTYYRVTNKEDFRRCLLEDYPFAAGLTLYQEFESQRTAKYGIVPLPVAGEKVVGGHAVLCIGYDDDFINSDWAKQAVATGYPIHAVPKRVYIFRNSWSNEWGHNGDFAIDAEYVENSRLCGDAWTQRPYEVGTNNGT